MQLIKELSRGLGIIEPFLKGYGFELDEYGIEKKLEGHFALATYKNNNKKFIIDYQSSLGQVLYQYENSIASHPFYLDNLGFEDNKQHKGFISTVQLQEFYHILHDFEYLTEDFFKGECRMLQRISTLKENVITEVDRNIRKVKSYQFDSFRIEKARQYFSKKEFQKCLDIYRFVDNKDLFGELDKKAIEYCKRHV
jgi:hypothetical protein